MSYLVLARKWRPMTFDDLVGQEHVSKTLSNAITSGRIAHAFLFTGVRGVGKTTSARILAKSLNCHNGPTPKPCLTCPACTEIAAGNDIDVQEIDGASYNGVDEVRKLQESLPYRPSRDRFKVVIVDEVHMLSANAWNAFLKTLEEPPPHVKFVFATTEVHKVPVTILSRCQRYDFKLISDAAIAKQLRYVLEQEGIKADEAAVSLIAREAAGSMRDAMSLLDQAIAWNSTELRGDEISQVLGIAGRGALLDVAEALVQGQPDKLLLLIGQLAEQGFDLLQVARDTLEVLRDLVVVKVCRDPSTLTQLTPDELARVRSIAQCAAADDLMRLHLGFSNGFDQVVFAPMQRSALEMLLVRLALRPPLLPIDDIVTRVQSLAKHLGPAPMQPRMSPEKHVRNQALETAPKRPSSPIPPIRGNASQPAAAPTPAAPGSGVATSIAATSSTATSRVSSPNAPSDGERSRSNAAQVTADGEAVGEPVQTAQPPLTRVADDSRETDTSRSERWNNAQTALLPEQQERQEAQAPSTPPPTPQSALPIDDAALKHDKTAIENWRKILEKVATHDQVLASVLAHAAAPRVTSDEVCLQVEKDSFYADALKEPAALDLLIRMVREFFGGPTQVSLTVLDPSSQPTGETLFDRDNAARAQREKQHRQRVENNALVRCAVEHLGATIENIKLVSEGN